MPARAFLCRPPEKSGPDLGTVVEGEDLGADDLISLMALARDDDNIAGAGPGQRALDGSFPVGNCLMLREPTRDARHDVGDDRLRWLAPWIIGGDPHVIGEARGDLAHERPLAAIAIAAAAEDDGEPAARAAQLARGLQRTLERVGSMGVVDHHEERLPRLHPLEASRDGGDGAEGARDKCGSMPRAMPTPVAARR